MSALGTHEQVSMSSTVGLVDELGVMVMLPRLRAITAPIKIMMNAPLRRNERLMSSASLHTLQAAQ